MRGASWFGRRTTCWPRLWISLSSWRQSTPLPCITPLLVMLRESMLIERSRNHQQSQSAGPCRRKRSWSQKWTGTQIQRSFRRPKNATYSDKTSRKVKCRHNRHYPHDCAIVNGILSEIAKLLSDVPKLFIDVSCFKLVVLIEHVANLSPSALYTWSAKHGIREQDQWYSVSLLVKSRRYQ